MKINNYIKILLVTIALYIGLTTFLVLLELHNVIPIHIMLSKTKVFNWSAFVILGVFVTGLTTLVGQVQNSITSKNILKHQMIAENIAKARIEWLKTARAHFGEYLSLMRQSRYIINSNSTLTSQQEKTISSLNRNAEKHYYQLMFMLNPEEEISKQIDSLTELSSPDGTLSDNEFQKITHTIQKYFHDEWTKAKKEIETGNVSIHANQTKTTVPAKPKKTNIEKEKETLKNIGIFADQLNSTLTFAVFIFSAILSNITDFSGKAFAKTPLFSIPFVFIVGFSYGGMLALKSISQRWDTSILIEQKPIHRKTKLISLVCITIIYIIFRELPLPNDIGISLLLLTFGLLSFLLCGLSIIEETLYYFFNNHYRSTN